MRSSRNNGRAAAAGILVASLALVMLTVGSASAAAAPLSGGPSGPSHRLGSGAGVAAAVVAAPDPAPSVPELVATVGVGMQPASGAYDAANGFVYVANEFADNLTVLNGTSVQAWINFDDSTVEAPDTVVYDPATQVVYAVDQTNFVNGGGAVTVVQGLSVLTNLYVGTLANAAVLDPTNGYLYVTDSGTSYVSVINAAGTATIANITVGTAPTALAYDPADGYVYVANEMSANVSILSGTSVVGSLPAGSRPVSVAYDPLDQDIYVANNYSANVTVYNGLSQVGGVSVGAHPEFVAFNPTVGAIEVTVTGTDSLVLLSGTSEIGSFGVLAAPVWVGVGPGDPFTYVADENASSVTVFNGTSYVGNASVGRQPTFGVADPLHGFEFVLNSKSNTVSIFATAYRVTFAETGLASGTNWSVTLGASTGASNGSAIGFSELSGSYAYTIGTPNGYTLVSSSPASPVTVTNRSVTVAVVFAPSVTASYNLTFVETGLNGCPTSGGHHHWGDDDRISAWGHSGGGGGGGTGGCCSGSEGSDSVVAWGDSGGGGGSGGCCSGSEDTHSIIAWGHSGGGGGSCCGHPCCGSSPPTNLTWSVTVGNVTKSTSGTSISFTETNGVYAYTIGTPSGFAVTSSVPASPVTIEGANLTVNVTFSPILSITFQESGLARGTTWCVTLVNTTECSTSSQVVFGGLTSGTYGFSVGSVSGYTVRPASGSVTLMSQSATVQVTFSSTSHRCGGTWAA